jgi:hypothetical protein
MGRMTFHCGVSEDRESAVFEIKEDGKALAHMICDAPAVETIIRQLAVCRKSLSDGVAPELEAFARVEVEQYPGWKVPDTHNGPNSSVLLALRHPGMGWLGFLFEEMEARRVGKALLDTPATQPKSS